MYDYNQKAAELAVKYSTDVQPGEIVVIMGSAVANDLIKAVYKEVIKAGGHPFPISGIPGLGPIKYRYGSDEQIKFMNPVNKVMVETADVMINIFADTNRQEMNLIDPEKIKMSRTTPESQELHKIRMEREAKGEFRWVIVPYPCDAFAQDAKMDTEAYSEFVYSALNLQAENPAEHWQSVKDKQERIVQYLNQVEKIHVLGEDTDLTLNVKGRPWRNCCGQRNLPDGEVFTSPHEDSINGHIRFTYPGIFQGKEIENIFLEFKEGKVVNATAEKGQELLDSILEIENANLIGEFAVGTNYGVTKFTKNMLFDEKMGGTMHMALGMGFPETGSNNLNCVIHWDILKDMKSENSKIIADDKIIYQAGKWMI